MNTGIGLLDAIADLFSVEEGSPGRVNIANREIVCKPDDLRHELLHIALGHWLCCGRRVNAAADMALQPYLENPEPITFYGLPKGKRLGWYIQQLRPDGHGLFIGSQDNELRYQLQDLYEREYEDPLSKRLSESSEEDLGELFASAHRLGLVNPYGLPPPKQQCALSARSFCRSMTEVHGERLDLKAISDGPVLVGSDVGMTFKNRRIVAGVLMECNLKNCVVSAHEVVNCRIEDSYIFCHKSTNCVAVRTSVRAHEETNLKFGERE